MKTAKQTFEDACKNKENNIKTKLDNLIKEQIKLRNEIEKQKQEITRRQINKIIQEGGTKSNHFWQVRKSIISKNKSIEYDIITEDNITIENPSESKEYIAEYFENLYQAREGKQEYKVWTNLIKNKVKAIEKMQKHNDI